MISFRTFAVAALAALTITACGEASQSASAVKGTLEGKGYSVKVYTPEEYKTLSTAQVFTEPTNLKNHLTASKVESKEAFFIWFFADIGSASNWFDANTTKLTSIYSEDDMAIGTKDNTAYVGSKTVQIALGWGAGQI